MYTSNYLAIFTAFSLYYSLLSVKKHIKFVAALSTIHL